MKKRWKYILMVLCFVVLFVCACKKKEEKQQTDEPQQAEETQQIELDEELDDTTEELSQYEDVFSEEETDKNSNTGTGTTTTGGQPSSDTAKQEKDDTDESDVVESGSTEQPDESNISIDTDKEDGYGVIF